MRHKLGPAALSLMLFVISAVAAAQPMTIRFDSNGNGQRGAAAAGTTIFHGTAGTTGMAATATSGTTVFHGTAGGNGLPAATGSSAAPPPPTGAGG